MKQILLAMNEKSSFIIEDLDDFHLVIKADEEWRVRKELESEVRLCIQLSLNHPFSIEHSLRRTRIVWMLSPNRRDR